MIIQTDDFKARVRSLWPSVQFPMAPRSSQMFAFDPKYIENEWKVWWEGYKEARVLTYLPCSGMCDMFADENYVETNRSVLEWAAKQSEENRDVVSSFVRANVTIPTLKGQPGSIASDPTQPDYSLNGIPSGGHATTLGALSNEQKTDFTLVLWEPQTEQFIAADVAARDGVMVYDCIT